VTVRVKESARPRAAVRDCDTCGNEIPAASVLCPHCESPQHAGEPVAKPRQLIRTVNLEDGMPSVEEGEERLERELNLARQSGVRLVRVIHGWGSGGKGGLIRAACRALLKRKLAMKQIRSFMPGDEYSGGSDAARSLRARHPVLRSSERTDRANAGITFVEL
jgi:hypothetical protein